MSVPARLFEPVKIGPLTLRNRVVMAPMTRKFSHGGVPTAEVGDYYVRRAEGGVGMVITEGVGIDDPGSLHDPAIPNLHAPAALEAWKQIAARVKGAGAAFIPQLWHVGGYRAAVAGGNTAAISPSGMYVPGSQFGSPATQEQITAVVDAYAGAAEAAHSIGCDGIEIHGAHGYLIDQFLWPGTNHRRDEYGGDLEGRSRLACEVVAACRRRTSESFPIFFRFSQWKTQDYSARLFAGPGELEAFLDLMVTAGVDVFDCSTRRFWVPEFEGSELGLAGWTRKLSGRPTMTVGSVGLDNDVVATLHRGQAASMAAGLDTLERLLARGDFDLVGVGRALLADPAWAGKVQRGETASLQGFTKEHLEVLT